MIILFDTLIRRQHITSLAVLFVLLIIWYRLIYGESNKQGGPKSKPQSNYLKIVSMRLDLFVKLK